MPFWPQAILFRLASKHHQYQRQKLGGLLERIRISPSDTSWLDLQVASPSGINKRSESCADCRRHATILDLLAQLASFGLLIRRVSLSVIRLRPVVFNLMRSNSLLHVQGSNCFDFARQLGCELEDTVSHVLAGSVSAKAPAQIVVNMSK